MSTSFATAASGSDASRAGYARNHESNNDSNRLRLSNATASAFDLLLGLPIFDSEIPAAEPVVADQQVDEPSDKEAENTHEHSDVSNTASVAIPFVAPPIKNVEESAPTVSLQDSDSEPVTKLNDDSPATATPLLDTKLEAESVNPSQTDVKTEGVDASLATDRKAIPLDAANQDQTASFIDEKTVDLAVVDQNHTDTLEFAEPTSSNRVEAVSDKSNRSEPSKEKTASPEQQVEVAKAVDSRPRDDSKNKPDRELTEKSTSGAPTPSRRAERLADAKHGGRNNDEIDHRRSSEKGDVQGIHDLLIEATKTDEPLDQTKINPPELALASSEILNSVGPIASSPTSSANIASSVVASGIATSISQSTATTGIDGGKPTITGGVNGIQGSSTISNSASTKSAPSTTGGSAKLTPYQESRVLQRVLKGLEQLKDGGGQVRLRLHPPELGSLQVTIRVEAQQVSASIEVEHASARDVLLSNLPQLQSQLADQGLNITQFDVKVVEPSQWSQGSDLGFASNGGQSPGQSSGQNNSESNRSSRYRYMDRLRNQLELTSTAESSRPTHSQWTRKNGELDVTV